MKKLLMLIGALVAVGLAVSVSGNEEKVQKSPTFEDAVALIKEFEGLHKARHWPLVGYGHKVQAGDKIARGKVLSESEADALLRKDLAKFCAIYRNYGADSLLLGALAYNCGPGVVNKSSVLAKLKAGNRDIESSYIAHSKYKGKTLSQLKRRRETELEVLFVKDPQPHAAAEGAVEGLEQNLHEAQEEAAREEAAAINDAMEMGMSLN